jgi:hypothetical protein
LNMGDSAGDQPFDPARPVGWSGPRRRPVTARVVNRSTRHGRSAGRGAERASRWLEGAPREGGPVGVLDAVLSAPCPVGRQAMPPRTGTRTVPHARPSRAASTST